MSFTRELAAYLDEPPQMPSGAVGKNGMLRLEFARRGESTALVAIEQRVPLLAQRALYWDKALPQLPCVYIITTSGCILQGDRIHLTLRLAANAEAHVTTQASTKIHEMDANFAAQTQDIVLEENAYLEYLPEPLIPHKHARFVSQTHVTLAANATLLYSEIVLSGRKYYRDGEQFAYDLFGSNLCVARPDGSELAAEKLVVEPRRATPQRIGVMGDFDVFGNAFLLTPLHFAEAVYAQLPAIIHPTEAWAAGASLLPNNAGLVYKVLGCESETVVARMREFWGIVRQTIRGVGLPRKVWC